MMKGVDLEGKEAQKQAKVDFDNVANVEGIKKTREIIFHATKT